VGNLIIKKRITALDIRAVRNDGKSRQGLWQTLAKFVVKN
jgi:hypothetical protein